MGSEEAGETLWGSVVNNKKMCDLCWLAYRCFVAFCEDTRELAVEFLEGDEGLSRVVYGCFISILSSHHKVSKRT